MISILAILFLFFSSSLAIFVSTFAGTRCSEGYLNGPRLNAQFNSPYQIALSQNKEFIISDGENNLVRKINRNGIVSTIAGTFGILPETRQETSVNSPGHSLDSPNGIAVDSFGNIFIADSLNNRILKLTTSNILSTIYPNPNHDHPFDSTFAPRGMTIDNQNNLIFTDPFNSCVRKLSPSGVLSILVGPCTFFIQSPPRSNINSSPIQLPTDVILSSDSLTLYIVDSTNHCIKSFSLASTQSHQRPFTVAGTCGQFGHRNGPSHQSLLYEPISIAINHQSNTLYISELGNNRIRQVDLGTKIVSDLAGDGEYGHRDGDASIARFSEPNGMVYHDGSLYVVDKGSSTIRRIHIMPNGVKPRRFHYRSNSVGDKINSNRNRNVAGTFMTRNGDSNRQSTSSGTSNHDLQPRPIDYTQDMCCICLNPKHRSHLYNYCRAKCGMTIHSLCAWRYEHKMGHKLKECPMCRNKWMGDVGSVTDIAGVGDVSRKLQRTKSI